MQGIVDDVAEVQPFWASCRSPTALAISARAAEVLADEVDEIARLLTAEQGKPITESYTMELLPTIDALNWCAEDGPEDPRRREDPHGAGLFLLQARPSSPTSRSAWSA